MCCRRSPLPATQSVTLTETGGTATTYSGSAPGGFSLSDPANGSIGANGSNSLAFGVTGTANTGTITGTYTITNVGNGGDVQGAGANKSVLLTENIGNALVGNSGDGTFGPAMFGVVGSGGSYAGLSSTAMTGTGTPGGAGIEHSVATILLGGNSGQFTGGSANVSMAWRNRMLVEAPGNDSVNGPGFPNGTPTSPPLNRLPLISDVVRLLGMGTPNGTAPVQTDPFALQVSFNPATLKAEGATDANMATRGNLYLATLLDGTWQNAIVDDFAVPGGTTTTYNGQTINVGSGTVAAMSNNMNRPFIGTFSQWELDFDPTGGNLQNFVGVYGVDPNTLGQGEYNAWAIINHNSDFAVVPEPSAIVLAAFGLLGGLCLIRRRKSVAAA